jgi:hypothetical protein
MRERLPDTRASVTKRLEIVGAEPVVHATLGFYDDGRPGELWLRGPKMGSLESGLADGLAISVSIGLQHGVPIEAYLNQFRAMHFEPTGRTMDGQHPSVTSILDYLARWISGRANGA